MSQVEILRVEHLKKYFPVEKSFLEKALTRARHFVKAVDDVSFSVTRGEIFTLAGKADAEKQPRANLL